MLSDDPFSARIEPRPVDLPPASGDSYHTASKWLEACLKSHTDCEQEDAYAKPMPTRVIDVGPSDGSTSPFLCVTNAKPGSWVTLSHCWGGLDPLKTTLETLKSHQSSLPLGKFPPLFRDAVLITRRLNYRYLWIDSLCIIQDSPSDWESESSSMGYIYKHAIFTIAAETSSSSSSPILSPSRASVTYPVKVSCHDKELRGSAILYRPRFDVKGPLSRRAWVLQEDVLSTRVLRFTEST
jgi:hypothetical protein